MNYYKIQFISLIFILCSCVNKSNTINQSIVSKELLKNYPWKSWDSTYTGPPEKWHHDIFYKNGEPFSEKEVRFIEEIIRSVNN